MGSLTSEISGAIYKLSEGNRKEVSTNSLAEALQTRRTLTGPEAAAVCGELVP